MKPRVFIASSSAQTHIVAEIERQISDFARVSPPLSARGMCSMPPWRVTRPFRSRGGDSRLVHSDFAWLREPRAADIG